MTLFKKKKQLRTSLAEDQAHILSEDLSFAAQEAYKSLRTNVMFSLTNEGCKVIIVTSPGPGEAKSTTAVNMALSFAQNRSRVLLVDCDLRMPTAAQKLQIDDTPGLSDLLVGQARLNEVVHVAAGGLFMIPAGTIPPNPAELLGSRQMTQVLESLRKNFDYVILDTPPILTVSDAVVLSPMADGVVLVGRQFISTNKEFRDAISQLEFVNAHIIGFVLTDVESEKKHGDKYGKYSSYGYGYASAGKKSSAAQKSAAGNAKTDPAVRARSSESGTRTIRREAPVSRRD